MERAGASNSQWVHFDKEKEEGPGKGGRENKLGIAGGVGRRGQERGTT